MPRRVHARIKEVGDAPPTFAAQPSEGLRSAPSRPPPLGSLLDGAGPSFWPTRFSHDSYRRTVAATVANPAQIAHTLAIYGLDAPPGAFGAAALLRRDPTLDLRVHPARPGGTAMRLLGNAFPHEGGDHVFGPRRGRSALCRGDLRPNGVPKHRVITHASPRFFGDRQALYRNDLGPFLFVGHGEGLDYRTKFESLVALADTGVTVIAIDLARSPNATSAAPDQASSIKRGTFFHLDTVFRPLPFGALIVREGLSPEGLELLETLYGPENLIELNQEQALRFGANGRLVHHPGHFDVLFYPEGAFDKSFFEGLAQRRGCELDVFHIGHGKRSYDLVRLKKVDEVPLCFVPLPTTQALRGGGAVSCVTQVLPSRAGLRFLVVPPFDYPPPPSEALNWLERANIAGVSRTQALEEYVELVERIRSMGFAVDELPARGGHEAIFTRDPADTALQRHGRRCDPAQTPMQQGDIVTIYLSRFTVDVRAREVPELLEGIVMTLARTDAEACIS